MKYSSVAFCVSNGVLHLRRSIPCTDMAAKRNCRRRCALNRFRKGLAHITQFLYCQYNTAVRVWQEIVEPDKSGRRVATKSQSKMLFHACRFHYIGCGRKSQAVETEISQPAEKGLRLPVCPVGSTADAFRISLIPPHLSVIAHASLSENGV